MPGRHVVVLGLIAAGKSTVAEAVAERLGRPHHDSDRQVEALVGTDGAGVVREHGVDALHRLEEAVLLGALSVTAPAVVSGAAWVVESSWCREALRRRARVAWLDVPVEVALARTGSDEHRRPIERDELVELARRRAPMFEEVADVRLDATRPTDELVDAVVRLAG